VHLPLHKHEGQAAAGPVGDEHVQIDAGHLRQLSSVFAPPRWLSDLGRSAWLMVGAFALVAGLVWLLGTTKTIVVPVTCSLIVATVAMPFVTMLARHMPRILAAALVLLALVAFAVVLGLLVVGGIKGQAAALGEQASAAADKAQAWLEDVGFDEQAAADTKKSVKSETPKVISSLVHGVIDGIRGLTSVVFGLSLAALSLFFVLKDGPGMRSWVDAHLGVPLPVAQTITGGVIRSLRGYFRGVTIVAVFNGIVVGLGALLLGVPLAGTIAVVTFVTAYVPYVGAFVAGAFAVVLALGATTVTKAAIMLVIVLLANGLLQNILQPFLFGAALNLNPLVVLVVTIGAGCLFGMVGLILAAPLTSAAVHVSSDLAGARAAVRAIRGESSPPAPG
jgi:putative heme transporter